MRWKIVASTEVPQDGRVAPESVIGVWDTPMDALISGPGVTARVADVLRGLPLQDAVYIGITRLS